MKPTVSARVLLAALSLLLLLAFWLALASACWYNSGMLEILRSRYPALLALLAQLLALAVIANLLLLFARFVDWRPSLWQAALAQGALAAALSVHALSKCAVAWASGGWHYAVAAGGGVLLHTGVFVAVLSLV